MKTNYRLPLSLIISILLIVLCDVVFTLLGQPDSYWIDSAKVSEGSPLGVATLSSSPLAFIVFMSLYMIFWGFVLRIVNIKYSIPITIALAFGHIAGSSSWIGILTYKFFGHNNNFLAWYIMLAYVSLFSLIIGYFIYKEIHSFNPKSLKS
jgi:hypothetical protein